MKRLKMKYASIMFLYYWALSKCLVRCHSDRLFNYLTRRALFYLRWHADLVFENEKEP